MINTIKNILDSLVKLIFIVAFTYLIYCAGYDDGFNKCWSNYNPDQLVKKVCVTKSLLKRK